MKYDLMLLISVNLFTKANPEDKPTNAKGFLTRGARFHNQTDHQGSHEEDGYEGCSGDHASPLLPCK